MTDSEYADAKRVFDVVVALAALLATLPLWPLIALAIWRDSPGPILFRQVRVGQNDTRFTLLKFRTMRVDTPHISTHEMKQSGRSAVTRVGGPLRRYSLDELPQLVNVLRGDMSLVGPRPALPSQVELLAMRSASGVDALVPGLTGWAQINGRDDLDDTTKAAFDADYLKLRGFFFDLNVVVRTFAPVAAGRGSR